jgi:hypothetical protein
MGTMQTETTNAPLIIGLVSVVLLIAAMGAFMPDPQLPEGKTPFDKSSGVVSDHNKSLAQGPNLEVPPISKPAPLSKEALHRFELVKGLRERFTDGDLRTIARASLAIETRVRQEKGENDAAYAMMDLQWAKLCKEKKITEEERDALEDEAIRKAWIKPLINQD